MINLSYHQTLYSYDGIKEATVTPDTELIIQIYTDVRVQTAVLQYTQENRTFATSLELNDDGYRASINGGKLKSGALSLSAVFGTETTNTVQIHLTKLEDSAGLVDDDVTFTVDRDKRLIFIPTTSTLLAVQHDANSEAILFQVARYADGIDLSTKIPFVNYQTPDGETYQDGLTIKKIEEGYIYCVWVVTGFATRIAGQVQFSLEFYSEDYRWQTQITSLPVIPSIQGEYTGQGPSIEGIDHRSLSHRDAENQHPITAIEGLKEVLERIPKPTEALTNAELEELLK